jgi:hypothetical protein
MSKLQPTKATDSIEAARNHWCRQRGYICNLIVWWQEKTQKKNRHGGKDFDSERAFLTRNKTAPYCQQTATITNQSPGSTKIAAGAK